MFTREFECPSCGAPIQRRHLATKTLGCLHCGQTSHLIDERLDKVGPQQLLIDYGSVLAIGQQLKIGEDTLLILGRIRLDYSDGFWDEWFAQSLDTGEEHWIQEDDGSFTLYQQGLTLENPPDWEAFVIGQEFDINDSFKNIFLTAKSRASVNGGEGELPFRIIPGELADFVDGIMGGKLISLELLPDHKVLYMGELLESNSIIDQVVTPNSPQ